MGDKSLSKIFKEYKNDGGTLNFAKFAERHNILNQAKENSSEMLDDMFQTPKMAMKNATGDNGSISEANNNASKRLFGINKTYFYVALGLIAASIGVSIYIRRKNKK